MKKMMTMALLVAAMMSLSASASAQSRRGAQGKKQVVMVRKDSKAPILCKHCARFDRFAKDARFDRRFAGRDARFDRRFDKRCMKGKDLRCARCGKKLRRR